MNEILLSTTCEKEPQKTKKLFSQETKRMNVNYKLKEIVLHGLDFPIAKYRNNKRICSQSNDAHFFKVKVIRPE